MVFLDYVTHTFTGNGQTFTVPYKAMITCEINSLSFFDAGSRTPATIALNSSSVSNSIVKPVFTISRIVTTVDGGGFDSDNSHRQEMYFSPVYDSGQIISVFNFTSINATIHIFRLPEAP